MNNHSILIESKASRSSSESSSLPINSSNSCNSCKSSGAHSYQICHYLQPLWPHTGCQKAHLWVNLSRQLSPTQPFTMSPPVGKQGRTGRVKMRKLVSWDKGSLRGKAKPFTQTKQNHFMASSHQQAGVQPLPGRQSLSWLRGKSDTITLTIPYAFLFFPKVLLLSTASCGVGYPFGLLGTDVPAVPLLSLLCTLPYSERKLKSLFKHCSATAKMNRMWSHIPDFATFT